MNEVDGVNIEGYPTIKLWVRGKKDTTNDYEGERNVEGMIKFLKENT